MLRGCVYSVISACLYGSMAVLAKLAYQAGMDEWQMMLCRFFVGSLLILCYLLVRGPRLLLIPWRKLAAIALIGTVIYTAQSACYVKALKYIQASTVSLVLYAYPAVVTLLSALIFRLKLDRYVILSVLTVTGGCALVFSDAFSRSADPRGLILALSAMAIFSCYLILCQRVLAGIHPLAGCFWMLFFTGLGFAVVGSPAALLDLNAQQLLIGAAFGLLPTALAVSLLFTAIELVGSAYASIFSSLEPVATIVLAALFLGEPVLPIQLMGAALILAGIVLPNLRLFVLSRRMPPQGVAP